MTESYGASTDPPDDTVMACTIKVAPYKLEHAVAWAKELFESLFHSLPLLANQYLDDRVAFQAQLQQNANTRISSLKLVHRFLVRERPRAFADCVALAIGIYTENFDHAIASLVHQFPEVQLTEGGQQFWATPKRFPHAAPFDLDAPATLDFVLAAANLFAIMFGFEGSRDPASGAPRRRERAHARAVGPARALRARAPERRGHGRGRRRGHGVSGVRTDPERRRGGRPDGAAHVGAPGPRQLWRAAPPDRRV